VAAERLLDDLAVADLRGPEVLEARLAALARAPWDPAALYLVGRLEGRDGGARLERAFLAGRDHAWALHGLAWFDEGRGRGRRALELEGRALERARTPGERAFFATALARVLLRQGRSFEARGVLERELAAPELLPAARAQLELELAHAELSDAIGPDAERGLERALRLLRERDFGPTDLSRLARLAAIVAPAVGRSAESVALALRARPGADRALLASELVATNGGGALALAVLDRERAASGRVGDLGPEVRAARLAGGELAGAARRWLEDLPAAVLDAEGLPHDPVLRRLVELLLAADPLDAEQVAEAGEALLRAGWYREGRGLADHLAGLDLDAAEELGMRAELARAALEGIARALRGVDDSRPTLASATLRPLEPGPLPELEYEPPVRDLSRLLVAVQDELQNLADELAARYGDPPRLVDLSASPRIGYGPAGEVVHPGPRFTATDGEAGRGEPGTPVPGLAAELAQLLRFGIFGEVIGGGGPDGTVLRRVHVEWVEGEHLGVPYAGDRVVCDGADVPSRPGRFGALITGAAVHEGYWIDLQLVRRERDRWAALERAFLDPARPGRAAAALAVRGLTLSGTSTPGVARGGGRDALVPLLGEADRVRLAVLAERRAAGVEPAVGVDELLEVVAVHEEGHLCDRTRLLPLHENAPELLVLLLRGGFSPTGVAQRLEYRAQLTALCATEDPRLALAETVGLAEERQGAITPHAGAYATLLEDLLRELDRALAEDPQAWPELDPGRYLAHQLHLLPPEKIRAVSRSLAERLGLSGD
jgi:hypothetical protein